MSVPGVKVEAQPPFPLTPNGWAIDVKPLCQPDSPIKEESKLFPHPVKPAMDEPELPKPKTGRRKPTAPPPVVPVLIDHLPSAWDRAHEEFDELERCVYERKDLGLSREQDEMMVCDCLFDRRESQS